MKALVVALIVGGLVGAVFALVRSVPPAPASWAGVAGIVGIVGGWQGTTYLISALSAQESAA